MLRFAAEENWEEFKKELDDLQLTPKEEQELANEALRKFHWLAWQQALPSEKAPAGSHFRVALLYKQLDPQDGIQSALARVIVAFTETTNDCLRRASASDALPVRDLEHNVATKGALVLSALTKAWDSHREHMGHSKKGKRE